MRPMIATGCCDYPGGSITKAITVTQGQNAVAYRQTKCSTMWPPQGWTDHGRDARPDTRSKSITIDYSSLFSCRFQRQRSVYHYRPMRGTLSRTGTITLYDEWSYRNSNHCSGSSRCAYTGRPNRHVEWRQNIGCQNQIRMEPRQHHGGALQSVAVKPVGEMRRPLRRWQRQESGWFQCYLHTLCVGQVTLRSI